MDGEGDKKPIPGISELPVGAESEGASEPAVGEDRGRRQEVPSLGAPRRPGEKKTEEEEVIRLGVEERRPERFRPAGPDGLGAAAADRNLRPDAGLEGGGDEGTPDLEDAWQSPARRKSPIGLIVLTGLLVAVVLGVAYWRIPKGEATLGQRATDLKESLESERREREEALLMMERLESALRQYLSADTVEEKAKFVRDRDRVLPLMKRYYAERGLEAQRYERIRSFYPVGVDNYPFLVVQVVLQDGTVSPLLLEQVGEDEIRFDWESEVAYQPMSLEDFLARRPEKGVDFRVYAKYDQFYAFEFADSEKWVSLMLTERNSDEFLFGYVERGSASHEKIEGLLGESESKQEAMLLRLRFLPGSLGNRSVLVEEVVAPRWAYVDNGLR